MTVKDFDRHVCLVLFAQGQWKDKHHDKILSKVKRRFFELSGHADCEICNTCPICNAIEQLFDPMEPGEYDTVCGLCHRIYAVLRERLGKHDGAILFSHYITIDPDLIDKIFEEPRIKKVFVLELYEKLPERMDDERLRGLESKVIAKKDYRAHEGTKNVILEIRRDEYMK
jgi:hypothetical protein